MRIYEARGGYKGTNLCQESEIKEEREGGREEETRTRRERHEGGKMEGGKKE